MVRNNKLRIVYMMTQGVTQQKGRQTRTTTAIPLDSDFACSDMFPLTYVRCCDVTFSPEKYSKINNDECALFLCLS
jgi:hypothetical protein